MLNSILALLPKLNPKELDVVQAMVAKLGRKDEEVPPLYTALVMNLGSKIPYSKFQQTNAYQVWKQNHPLVMTFVDQTWPDLQDVEKLGLLRYLLGLLVDDLRRRGIPVTPGSITSNLNGTQDAFDRAFPGYRDSGLAFTVVKMLVNNG